MAKNTCSIENVLSEMMKLKSQLPLRPTPDEVTYATQFVHNVESTLTSGLEELLNQTSPAEIPHHVFRDYLKMTEDVMRSKADEDKREAVSMIVLEGRYQRYDAMIENVRHASLHPFHNFVRHEGSSHGYKQPVVSNIDSTRQNNLPLLCEDSNQLVSLTRNFSAGHLEDHPFKESASVPNLDIATTSRSRILFSPLAITSGPQADHEIIKDGARQYFAQVLSAINNAKSHRLTELILNGMGVGRIPAMIGELTNLTSINISGCHLQALPESIGELSNLVTLKVSNNVLRSLPETIGCLTNLKHLDIQSNNILELPMTIGLCKQLVELRADVNELKVLPEATGNLVSLQRLCLYMNRIHRLPTTLNSLSNLMELDVKYNELEKIPDSVCFLPNVRKLDVSSNFVVLRELPRAIGQMKSLRELNISNNHISMLPLSFAMLTGLEKLEMNENPWVLPPLDVVGEGKEAVLKFMIYLVSQEAKDEEATERSGMSSRISSVFKRKKSQGSAHKVKQRNDLHIGA